MNIPYVMKKCSKCGKWLVASEVNFHRGKRYKYGLSSQCKECANKRSKQWYKVNREKKLEYDKRWQQANRSRKVENNKQWYEKYGKQYYENNKEKVAENQKRYHQSPKGQVVEFNKTQRRRIKEEQQGDGITKDQWLEMMKFFDWKCAYSGETLTKDTRSIDHIVPLNSNGDNMIWNLVPMTRSLNSSKQDKDMLEWYREQDFYSEDRLEKIYKWQEYAYNKYGKNTQYFNSGDIQIKLI